MSVFDERFLKDVSYFLRIVCIEGVIDMSDTADISVISVISDTTIGDDLIYDTTMVSKFLGVQESTLRKYCSLMQKHNYEFNKNSVGHRVFYKRDIEVIKKIVDLKNDGSLTLNQAVKTILDSDIDNIEDITDIEVIPNHDYKKLLDEFSAYKREQMEFNKEQMEFNKTLIEQLQKQEQYIKNSIDDRDSKLMLALKESMESRRQIAAAVTELEEAKKKKKQWWKFWD